MSEDLPSLALVSRLWHALVLILIGAVAVGASFGSGPVTGVLIVIGVLLLVGGYLGLAVPRLRFGRSEGLMLGCVLAGAAVLIVDRPVAVVLLLGIVPLLFYFAPLRVAILGTCALTALGCLSLAMSGIDDWPGVAVGLCFATGVSVVIGLWLSQVFRLNARQQRMIVELEESRAMVAEMARHAGAMQERTQISQDIHDGMAQHLSVLVMALRECTAHVETGDLEGLRQRLPLAREQSEQVLAECRFLLGQQSSAELERAHDLVHHLSTLFSSASGVPTQVEVAADLDSDEGQRLILRRVLTEALSNCLRHAGARHVQVSLGGRADGALVLQVVDDGVGFDPTTATLPSGSDVDGYGLPGLESRLARSGGTMSVVSEAGRGCRLEAVIAAQHLAFADPDQFVRTSKE